MNEGGVVYCHRGEGSLPHWPAGRGDSRSASAACGLAHVAPASSPACSRRPRAHNHSSRHASAAQSIQWYAQRRLHVLHRWLYQSNFGAKEWRSSVILFYNIVILNNCKLMLFLYSFDINIVYLYWNINTQHLEIFIVIHSLKFVGDKITSKS